MSKKITKFGGKLTWSFGEPTETHGLYWVELNVNCDVPIIKYEGFEHLATLEKASDNDNLIYSKKADFDFTSYFNTQFRCDHCGTKRERKGVHIFRSSSKEIMIAKSCAKEYFGVNIHNLILNQVGIFDCFKQLAVYVNEEHSEERITSSIKLMNNNKEIFHYALSIINQEGGFVSSQTSEIKMIPSTSHLVSFAMGNGSSKYEIKNPNLFVDNLDTIWNQTIETWKAKRHESTFNNNVYVSLISENSKQGFIVFAASEYLKSLQTTRNDNVFLGTIGQKKFTVKARFQKSIGFHNGFSYTSIFIFKTEEGNTVVLKNPKGDGVNIDQEATITGTIKEHKVYNGINQTVLIRCQYEVIW